MKRAVLLVGVSVVLSGSALADAPNYLFSYPNVRVASLAGGQSSGNPFENNFGPAPNSGGPPNDLQSASISDAAGSSASASVAEAPVFLQVQASSGPGSGYYQETANASAQLWWTITQPNAAPTPVHFKLQFDSTGTANGGYYEILGALSFFPQSGGGGTTTVAQICNSNYVGACNGPPTSGLFDQTVSLDPGSYTVQEWVSVQATQQGSGSADADPQIFIDPAFLSQHSGYALGTPLGLSGPAGVPEPAAWALMIVGLGLSGAAVRRGRAGPTRRLLRA